MGRYVPQQQHNRRRRIDDAPKIDSARVTTLGVFTILLGFFVGLVAWSEPNADKSVNLINTLQNTFKPLAGEGHEMEAASPIPAWLQKSQDGAPPLTTLKNAFPEAFEGSADRWGSVQLRFPEDRFQALILNQTALARDLVSGFSRPADVARGADDYTLEVTIGLDGRSLNQANALLAKTRRELLELGVNPTRLLIGLESGSEAITLRMISNDRYGGAL